MKPIVQSFRCKITKWTWDHQPVIAEFTVRLSDGTDEQFEKRGSIAIQYMRNELTKRIAVVARRTQ